MSLTFRTSPPAAYIPPTAEEMRAAASQVGLTSFARDLVADLCNLAAGGKVQPPSAYKQHIRDWAERTLPAPDSAGKWSIKRIASETRGDRRPSSTDNREVAVEGRLQEGLRYHQNVCDFLSQVDLGRFPGSTPLQHAVALLKLLSKQQGGSGGEAGEPLPIFQDNDHPEKVADALNDVMDDVDSLSQDELDMVDPEGKAHEVQDSSEGDGTRSGHQNMDRLKVAEDMVSGCDKRVMLDVSRTLDQLTNMAVRRQRLVQPDLEGEEVRRRPMRSLAEIARLNPQDLALRNKSRTLFLYKAATQQFTVRERVTRLEKKQAIFILLDGSGSMKGKKHWKASGVVMNRLKAVLSGDAEVWLSVFDTSLGKVAHAGTPTEARELVRKFMAKNFSGGGTDIAATVKAAQGMIEKMIKDGAMLYRPEIVVLTDEDTSVKSLKKSDVPGTKVHGFAMEVANPSLIEFARSTGGVGMDKF